MNRLRQAVMDFQRVRRMAKMSLSQAGLAMYGDEKAGPQAWREYVRFCARLPRWAGRLAVKTAVKRKGTQ